MMPMIQRDFWRMAARVTEGKYSRTHTVLASRALWPKPASYGLAIALNEQGEIVQSLHDTSGTHLRMVTSVKPVGDYLYLGSLDNDRIGKLKIR